VVQQPGELLIRGHFQGVFNFENYYDSKGFPRTRKNNSLNILHVTSSSPGRTTCISHDTKGEGVQEFSRMEPGLLWLSETTSHIDGNLRLEGPLTLVVLV
jgi:hypothetical protein